MSLPDAPRINPSILAADFVNMQSELARIASADFVHVDVMDNHFVPNLTFGASMVEQIARRSSIPIDAHLMIDDADTQAPAYAEAGASSVTFHLEAARAPVKLARDLRRKNVQAGVALRPATAVEPLLDIIGATVIGGTSLAGGKGKVTWTLFGVIFFVLLLNTLNAMQLSAFHIDVVKGVIILLAAFLDVARTRLLRSEREA